MSTPGRPPRRLRWVLAALLLVPLAEIAVIIATGRVIGVGWTVLLLVALVLLGAVLVRTEGLRTWRALQAASAEGRVPGRELLDAGLVLFGGLLLLLPGFLTDVVALVLVVPFTRPMTRRWLERMVRSRVLGVTVTEEGTRVWQPPLRPGGRRAGGPDGDPGGAGGPGRRDEVVPGEVVEGEIIDDDPPSGSGR